MFARVNRFQEHSIDALDESLRVVSEKIVPQLQTVRGFAGLLSLVNRSTNETLAITLWEDRAALDASEALADRVRREAAELTDADIRGVERYEVVMRVDA